MTDLASDLATLRIERQQPAARSWRWVVPVAASALLLAAVVYGLRARRALGGETLVAHPPEMLRDGETVRVKT